MDQICTSAPSMLAGYAVDDALGSVRSADHTRRAAAADVKTSVITRRGRNHGAVARNVGVELARTPYVALSDDDSWWEACWP